MVSENANYTGIENCPHLRRAKNSGFIKYCSRAAYNKETPCNQAEEIIRRILKMMSQREEVLDFQIVKRK